MYQYEAVIHVMRENGGYATFGHLYEHVLKVPGVIWKTKTPFASIRRIVQDPNHFFKIRPGLWALNEYKGNLPFEEQIKDSATEEKRTEFSHSFYQGLLVEIGNYKKYLTYVPKQDQNRLYLNTPLNQVVSTSDIFHFGYDRFVRSARTIDICWFNSREMPDTFIEVEHSTNFVKSLTKFVELQDFNVSFWIIAPQERKRSYNDAVSYTAFSALKKRIKFLSYDDASRLHSGLAVQVLVEQGLVSI